MSPTTFFYSITQKCATRKMPQLRNFATLLVEKSQKSTILYVMKAPKHYIPQSVSHYFTSIC